MVAHLMDPGVLQNRTDTLEELLDLQYRTRNDRIAKFKRRNLALYNRVVWGVLYHETFPELRFGFTNEVRDGIRKLLENSLNPK